MNIETSFVLCLADVSYNQFDDELIVIHLQSGNYFSLRGTAPAIWGMLLEGPANASSLAARFAGPRGAVAAQIAGFLQELAGHGLVTPSSEVAAAGAAGSPATPFTAPEMTMFDDLQDLLQADPIHEVADEGWPAKPNDSADAA
jgi:Coenzyme PQQ synthesis protein D (PqqD)